MKTPLAFVMVAAVLVAEPAVLPSVVEAVDAAAMQVVPEQGVALPAIWARREVRSVVLVALEVLEPLAVAVTGTRRLTTSGVTERTARRGQTVAEDVVISRSTGL